MATLRDIPTTYRECARFLAKSRFDPNARNCGYETSVLRDTFILDGHTFTCYWIKYFSTRIVCFYPDGSMQFFCKRYQTVTTVSRMNMAMSSSLWRLFRKKGELHWFNTASKDVYPFEDGDRIYFVSYPPFIDRNAIYGPIQEIGYNTITAINLMNM